MIINSKRKNYCLLFVNLAEFSNFGVIEKESTVECGKCNTKKVYYYHTVIHKRFRPHVSCWSKVPECSSYSFEFHEPIFNYDVFVPVLIFWSFWMPEFVKVFGPKFIGKDARNFGLWKTKISASNKEYSKEYLTYEFSSSTWFLEAIATRAVDYMIAIMVWLS